MGLYFGFVLRTVLMVWRCFSYCWAVLTQCQRTFLFLTSSHQPADWRSTRHWKETRLWQLPKRTFYTRQHHTQPIKMGEEEVWCVGCSSGFGWVPAGWWWVIVFICIISLSGVLSSSLLSSPHLFLIFHKFLLLYWLLNCSYLNPQVSFSHLPLLILSPSH